MNFFQEKRELENRAYEQGYRAGMGFNALHEEPNPPASMKANERTQFCLGFHHAIEDRLS